jgi:hypothetical protein
VSAASGSERPTLVIGDAHLRIDAPPTLGEALAALLESDRDAPVVFAGDTLDLPVDPEGGDDAALVRLVARERRWADAVRDRAARGVPTTFLAGNHDTLLTRPDAGTRLSEALGLAASDRASLHVSPWFHRLAAGRVHVEHGHAFDPDGAPTHPLAEAPRDDVGVAMLRAFVVPTGTHVMVHSHASTPLQIMQKLTRTFGARTPQIVARYIVEALGVVGRSGDRLPLADDRAAAEARTRRFADELGLDAALLEALLAAHATPTMADATATFLRLYLDRVMACLGLAAGLALGGAGYALASSALRKAGGSIAIASALAMAASIVAGRDRYGGRASRVLDAGARAVTEITGCPTAIFAHAHVEEQREGYANTGSFAFPSRPSSRPFLRVDADGIVTRAHWADGGART